MTRIERGVPVDFIDASALLFLDGCMWRPIASTGQGNNRNTLM